MTPLILLTVTFASALMITVITEGAFVLLLTKSKTVVLLSVAGNLATNPLLNICLVFIYAYFGSRGYYAALPFLEAGAVVCETFIYAVGSEMKKSRCFLVSLLANVISFGTGLLIGIII